MSATSPLPTAEQVQRAKWDLLLSDLEYRAEQVRQIKATPARIEVLKLALTAITSAVALLGGIGGGTVFLLHALGYIH
jgi:hypothetical protein